MLHCFGHRSDLRASIRCCCVKIHDGAGKLVVVVGFCGVPLPDPTEWHRSDTLISSTVDCR